MGFAAELFSFEQWSDFFGLIIHGPLLLLQDALQCNYGLLHADSCTYPGHQTMLTTSTLPGYHHGF